MENINWHERRPRFGAALAAWLGAGSGFAFAFTLAFALAFPAGTALLLAFGIGIDLERASIDNDSWALSIQQKCLSKLKCRDWHCSAI